MEERRPLIKIWASAPANIALIKYWGKRPTQLPQNASLSLTLDQLQVQTELCYQSADDIKLTFTINNQQRSADDRGHQWWAQLQTVVPRLGRGHYTIVRQANFPERWGLASSAAGFAALATCVWGLQQVWENKLPAGPLVTSADLNPADQATISRWARWGSGSAARSVAGPCMLWGTCPGEALANDDFAIVPSFAAHTQDWQDAVIVLQTSPCKISSSYGHQLMEKHPAATLRYAQAQDNLQKMVQAWKQDDYATILTLIEQEAWMLVALLLTSDPPLQSLTPATLEVIQEVQRWRHGEHLPVAFSLDAGPNVHVLYPGQVKAQVQAKLQQSFAARWPIYFNAVGTGIQLRWAHDPSKEGRDGATRF